MRLRQQAKETLTHVTDASKRVTETTGYATVALVAVAAVAVVALLVALSTQAKVRG